MTTITGYAARSDIPTQAMASRIVLARLEASHALSTPRSLLDPHWVSWWLTKRALRRVARLMEIDPSPPG